MERPWLVYVNDGGGRFEVALVLLEGEAYRLRVADVTGDGQPEVLVLIGYEPRELRIYAGTGAAGFLQTANVAGGGGSGSPYDIWFDTGDLNGDGLADLVTVEDEDAPDIEHVRVAYQENGMLQPLQIVSTIPKDGGNIAGGEVRIVDLNLDGRNDIVFTSSAFDMVALINLPGGGFRETHVAFPTAGSILTEALAVGDVDCDGCPDAVGANVGHLVLFPGVACAH